jgi:hypothetical protein
MAGARSTVVIRHLLPALLAVLLPAAAFGALLVAVPSASASATPGGAALAETPGPTVTPSTPSTTPYPPSAPTNLTATEVRAGSVTLTWTASRPGCCSIAGYEITYMRAFNDYGHGAARVGNVTTATITAEFVRTAQYTFTVSALDDMGRRSAWSNAVVVVIPNTDTGPDTVPPSAPTGLTVAATNGSSADLTWSPATDNVGVTGYDVYNFDGFFYSRLVATVADTSATVPLSVGGNAFYVRARDAAGNLSIATGIVTAVGTSPGTPPVGSCQVTYTTQAQWTGGFVAAVTIHNTGPAAVGGWALGFTFRGDQRTTSAWGATYTQSGAAVTVRNVDWTRTIPAGGSVTFGMQGAWTSSNAAPTAFTLNDTVCTAG